MMRAVTHILNGRDDKAKAIRRILDLFLPDFKNLSKDTPVLVDLPKGFSPAVIGTGVSVLTDLYFELEVKRETYITNKGNSLYVKKGAQRIFGEFSNYKLTTTESNLKIIREYELELEILDKFSQLKPNLFMACVILEIYKRCGILDFDLFNRAELYYEHCMELVRLFLQRVQVNSSVIANPVFGCMEHKILGDGDFILDGNLFDIKTTKSISVKKDERRQLFFYYLMNHVECSLRESGTRFDIFRLYIYKARHGMCIEIPINLRGANPLEVMKVITKIETGVISPLDGIEIVTNMLKGELNPKTGKVVLERKPKKKKSVGLVKKVCNPKLKKVFVCNETNEVFERVVKANEKYGYSKNSIYKYLKGERKYAITKNGEKHTWRVEYTS